MPKITLLSARGNVHNTGGINWGSNNKNHTRRFDAYIPIHLVTIRRLAPFFPKKGSPNPIIRLTWDDGTVMAAKFEGTAYNSHDKQNYPKQISSTPHKDELGRYLRERMGIPNKQKVEMSDFNTYGTHEIDIEKITDTDYKVSFKP